LGADGICCFVFFELILFLYYFRKWM
jgi:hypothetical protein